MQHDGKCVAVSSAPSAPPLPLRVPNRTNARPAAGRCVTIFSAPNYCDQVLPAAPGPLRHFPRRRGADEAPTSGARAGEPCAGGGARRPASLTRTRPRAPRADGQPRGVHCLRARLRPPLLPARPYTLDPPAPRLRSSTPRRARARPSRAQRAAGASPRRPRQVLRLAPPTGRAYGVRAHGYGGPDVVPHAGSHASCGATCV